MKTSKKEKPEKHIHTFQRIKDRKNLYMCIDGSCKYYADLAFLINKVAKCRFCGSMYTLDVVQLKRKDPRCENCRKRIKPDEPDSRLDKLLEGSGI